MIFIAPEDVDKIQATVAQAIATLGQGVKKVELDVDLGDQINPIEVSGYWVFETMRIDIKLKG